MGDGGREALPGQRVSDFGVPYRGRRWRGDVGMARSHARVASAAIAAGLTVGAALATPDAPVRAAGPVAVLTTGAASLPVPTADVPATVPVTAAAVPQPAVPEPEATRTATDQAPTPA